MRLLSIRNNTAKEQKNDQFYTFHLIGKDNGRINDVASELIESNYINEVYINKTQGIESLEIKVHFTEYIKSSNPERIIKRILGSTYGRVMQKI